MLSAATRVARYAVVPLLAFLALSAWALSSPVGSSPDEDYHLTSIWCGQGVDEGACEPGAADDQRRVPEVLPPAASCYNFEPEVSAGCQKPLFYEESDDLVSTPRGNFTGDYPPIFYFTMSTFVGDDVSHSVVAMRVVNAALFAGLVTALYWALPRTRRPMLVLGTVAPLVPLGMFLIPSINPSSWALIASALVFPALIGYFETTGRRRLALAAVAGIATVMGAGARADSAVYIVVAVALAVLLGARWRKGGWGWIGYPAVLCLLCAASYLSAGQSAAANQELAGMSTHSYDTLQQLTYNLLNAPDLWAGSFGSWDLGWLDTSLPSVVWVVNLATYGAVLYLGMRHTDLRKTVAVVTVLLAAAVIPAWVLLQTSDLVGVGVQPRYLLPLLLLLAQAALFRVDPHRVEISRSQLIYLVTGLTITNAISLHYNIRRYVTGTDVFRFDLDAGREWWWAIPLPPMATWLIGSIAFGIALWLCARALERTAATEPAPTGDLPRLAGPPPVPGATRRPVEVR